MLVSDVKSEKTALSLHLNVGSLNDPQDVSGMAHFCERMVLVGSKKFPEAYSYRDFVTKHGGVV
jgi:insulysin